MKHNPALALNGRTLTRRNFSLLVGSAVLASILPVARPQSAFAEETGKIAIVHSNDVHCKIDVGYDSKTGEENAVGYAGIAAVYKEAQGIYGAENTILVDAGDYLQGQSTGTLTKGEALVSLMNDTGYAFATIGNHEFDYGIEQLNKLVSDARFDVLCCNLSLKKTGEYPFRPYAIKELAGKKVAFVGIATPETLTKTNPHGIKDEEGNYLVGFCEDESGEALYAKVQETVDQARAEGADFVVALGHLGQKGVKQEWRSDTLVANTSGIDVLIDGHSHEIYSQTVQNKNGQDVIITQKGTTTSAVGRIVIDTNATPVAITAETVLPPVTPDPEAAAAVAAIQAQLESVKGRKVAATEYFLRAHEDDGTTWAVRNRETNLGDLVADAYRVRMNAQIGMVNGGGVRADIPIGEITYGEVIDVNPFSNNLCLVNAKGSTILDDLEFDFRDYPNGGKSIIQVSGITFEVRTDIESSVETDEMGNFVKVAGDRRIQNVKVNGELLDPDQTYTVASSTFVLINGGDGRTMWQDAEVLVAEGTVDFQAMSDYLEKDLNGYIGTEYASDGGQGRFVTKDGPDDPDDPDDPTPSSKSGTTPSATAKTGDPFAPVTVAAVSSLMAAAALAMAAGAAFAEEESAQE